MNLLELPKKKKFWNDLEIFECDLCPFDSLDEQATKEHIVKHKPVVVAKASPIIRVDRFGNEVKE